MTHGSARLVVAVFLLATALTLAQEDDGHPKPPASMLPPAPYATTQPPHTTTPKATTSYKNITTTTPSSHNTTTTHETTTTPTPHNTTTANATTASPTPHNTTTANATTASPTPHNTTTANATTASPTPHNTTTANTTTLPPTPKPEPTAPTNSTVGNYTVMDGNKLCIMVQAAIKINVNNSQMAGSYIVPGNATCGGKCQRNTASLKITLDHGYISMNFLKNDTTNVVFVSTVAVNLTYAFKSGVLSQLERKNESVQLFSMATSHSYSCKSESVFLGNGAYLEISQDRLQAFNFTKNQFGPVDLCKADQPDYRVAIGVGVVLIILIIIVVVAYLISRRRRTDGYQTL